MSFFKFDQSANAPSTMSQGAQQGVAIGSMFGPVGAGIGLGVGALAGAFEGSGAKKRARRRATNESYAFAEDVFSYAGKTRGQIGKEYSRNLSLLTATSASRGGTSTTTFEGQKGKLIQERDRALKDLDLEVKGFREGPNYEWFRKDYEMLTAGHRMGRAGGSSDRNMGVPFEWKIGGRESRSSRDLAAPYTKKMYSAMAVTSVKSEGEPELFMEYAKRVQPSMAQYEQLAFGGKEGRKSYNAYMETRIEAANKWYNAELAIREIENQGYKKQSLLMGNKS